MSLNKNIFNFNHIDKTKTLRLNSYTNTIITFSGAINMSSTGLIVIGTVVGSVTLILLSLLVFPVLVGCKKIFRNQRL